MVFRVSHISVRFWEGRFPDRRFDGNRENLRRDIYITNGMSFYDNKDFILLSISLLMMMKRDIYILKIIFKIFLQIIMLYSWHMIDGYNDRFLVEGSMEIRKVENYEHEN